MDCQILILYFSRHGSTKQLARQIARGVESTPHCEAILRTVEELSPHSHTPSDPIVTLDELKQCDGLAFGSQYGLATWLHRLSTFGIKPHLCG